MAVATLETLAVADLTVMLARKGGDVPLLNNVSFELERGRILGLIGESGSGKTMTCRAIAGALAPGVWLRTGEVRIGETVIRRGGERKLRRHPAGLVGMIFADPHASLDPLQKIGPQIAEVARVHRRLGRDRAQRETMALLEEVRIARPDLVYGKYPFELSGGMAQRAMIASVLAAKPHFILADEPTSALDATVQLEILDLLVSLTRVENVGILLTTHDMAVAARICDRIGVMYAGRMVELGGAGTLAEPQHPYTRLLLQARPRGTRKVRLAAIPGEPPVPGEASTACAFAPRCPYAQEVCADIPPPYVEHGDSVAACHFAGRLPDDLR
jgi:oligopeptide/dipeptide ABC transporter ATP-binding protein